MGLLGIADRVVFETPVAIIDLETTGLSPGADRVIEVSVIRLEPQSKPELVLDTLVNPRRPVAATEIHGITDADVADAPEFAEIAPALNNALSGAIIAAYNVYFDMRFLDYELKRAGVPDSPPHLCLMYLRPLLNLGRRCSLIEACRAHGVSYGATHVAADDAEAAASLMEVYFGVMKERKIRTFRELASLKNYKFLKSFDRDPLTGQELTNASSSCCLKSRSHRPANSNVNGEAEVAPSPNTANRALGIYWDALKAAVADLKITHDEIQHLRTVVEELNLEEEQVRVLHARAFASVILQFIDDKWLDDVERRKLQRLHQCLSELGWAPGE